MSKLSQLKKTAKAAGIKLTPKRLRKLIEFAAAVGLISNNPTLRRLIKRYKRKLKEAVL